MNAVPLLVGMACLFQPQDSLKVSFRGTIVAPSGRPIANTRVSIATAAPRVGQGLFCPSCYADCAKWARSDDQGRFEIPGLNPTLKFTLLASSPDNKAHLTGLLDPLSGEVQIVLHPLPTEFPRERTVTAQIVDDLNQPLGGVLVQPAGGRAPAWDLIAVSVNKDGSFVIDGLPPETYTVGVVVKGFAIDGGRLPYQVLRGQSSFGLRLQESIAELRIPLVVRESKE